MAVRAVVHYPQAVLKTPSEPLDPASPEAQKLARDLVDTMRASPACVGLAAPQIGVGLRAFCLDVSGHRKATRSHGLVVLLNAVVVSREGREVVREGCMSLPDLTANISRATTVVVEGVTPAGLPQKIQAEGFEARAFQHEIDHLDGLLFLDRVSSLVADVFPRKRYAR